MQYLLSLIDLLKAVPYVEFSVPGALPWKADVFDRIFMREFSADFYMLI